MTLAVLVGKERGTKAIVSTVAPRKSRGEWLAKRVMAWMREVGCEFMEITVKADNELALVAVVDAVGRIRAVTGGSEDGGGT